MARRAAGVPRPGEASPFRSALLAHRAQSWSHWATDSLAVEHAEFDRAIRAGEPLVLGAGTVFAVLHAMGDSRADIFAWGGDGYGRQWRLTSADELTSDDTNQP